MLISLSGSILLFLIAILYFLLFLKMPLGYLAWGGRYKGVLPDNLRVQSAISIPAQLFAIFVLLKLGGIFSGQPSTFIMIFGYVFMAFFLINTVMNLMSQSKYEKFIMTPVALWIFFCFLYLLIIKWYYRHKSLCSIQKTYYQMWDSMFLIYKCFLCYSTSMVSAHSKNWSLLSSKSLSKDAKFIT